MKYIIIMQVVQVLMLWRLLIAVKGPEIVYHRKKRISLVVGKIKDKVKELIRKVKDYVANFVERVRALVGKGR